MATPWCRACGRKTSGRASRAGWLHTHCLERISEESLVSLSKTTKLGSISCPEGRVLLTRNPRPPGKLGRKASTSAPGDPWPTYSWSCAPLSSHALPYSTVTNAPASHYPVSHRTPKNVPPAARRMMMMMPFICSYRNKK